MLIYTSATSPRLSYTFSTLLPALGINDYTITTSKKDFFQSLLPKINYSGQPICTDEIWIHASDLLFENTIEIQQIKCIEFNGSKAFFETPAGDFPFDIFAASFFLISRYEEYLPHKRDMYGRFAHENSLAFKESFLHQPLVNLWLIEFSKMIKRKFPSLKLSPAAFHFIPTYDIDIAWSYLHKGWLRNAGGLLGSLLKGDWSAAGERIKVLLGRSPDPFDSYLFLDRLHEPLHLNPIYFFLLARQNKQYDKNILPSETAMQKLVKRHHTKYTSGIHPSWQSGDKPELLIEEIKVLGDITDQKVTKSRQHYIRMALPGTYQQLADAGITEDYSMGYGRINGFRASYCLPYKWYDLTQQKQTNLTIFPFCYMDANSFYEQHNSCEEAFEELCHYHSITKAVGGVLLTIWHNQFLGTGKMFAGWRDVYEKFCKFAQQAEAK